MTVHALLSAMQKAPVVVVQHTKIHIVKVAAGENHLAMLSSEGELLTFGEGSMGQLGRLARSNHIRSSEFRWPNPQLDPPNSCSPKNTSLVPLFVDLFLQIHHLIPFNFSDLRNPPLDPVCVALFLQIHQLTHLDSSGYMADDSGKHLKLNVLENGKLVKFSNVFAGGFWTIASAEDGRLFACGLNNYAQLGLPLPTAEAPERDEQAPATENGTGDQPMETDEQDYRVTRLTHVKAFNSDKKWTHIAGVQHLVLRNEAGECFGDISGRPLCSSMFR